MEDNKKLFALIKSHKFTELISFLETHKDIDVNIRDDGNTYLLAYAIMYNQHELVELLINAGSKIDIVDHEGHSILYMVIKYGYDDILKTLIK